MPKPPSPRALAILIVLLGSLLACQQDPVWKPVTSAPLQKAHAHNDYHHKRPLQDALDHRFSSVEADIHLSKGKLLVAHYWFSLDARRTLKGLYLDPLRKRIQRNKGHVYPTPSPFFLLIDVKTDAKSTYLALHKLLAQYRDILTQTTPKGTQRGPVTVIVSGNRPLALMKAQKHRYAAVDGRPKDLNNAHPASLIPLISERWWRLFSWNGRGPMPPKEYKKLISFVQRAHRQKRMVRFWATPDRRSAARHRLWKTLCQAGVDLLNTDDLTGMQQFLLRTPSCQPNTHKEPNHVRKKPSPRAQPARRPTTAPSPR